MIVSCLVRGAFYFGSFELGEGLAYSSCYFYLFERIPFKKFFLRATILNTEEVIVGFFLELLTFTLFSVINTLLLEVYYLAMIGSLGIF